MEASVRKELFGARKGTPLKTEGISSLREEDTYRKEKRKEDAAERRSMAKHVNPLKQELADALQERDRYKRLIQENASVSELAKLRNHISCIEATANENAKRYKVEIAKLKAKLEEYGKNNTKVKLHQLHNESQYKIRSLEERIRHLQSTNEELKSIQHYEDNRLLAITSSYENLKNVLKGIVANSPDSTISIPLEVVKANISRQATMNTENGIITLKLNPLM